MKLPVTARKAGARKWRRWGCYTPRGRLMDIFEVYREAIEYALDGPPELTVTRVEIRELPRPPALVKSTPRAKGARKGRR